MRHAKGFVRQRLNPNVRCIGVEAENGRITRPFCTDELNLTKKGRKIMSLQKTFRVIGFVISVFILFGAPLYFSHKILTENFFANGEAYYKGAGHLFEENLKLGLLVSVTDQIFWTAMVSFILFFSISQMARKVVFRIMLTIFIAVLIVISLIYAWKLSLYATDYHSFCRSLDFITIWISRILGLSFSFVVVTLGDLKLRIGNTNR